MNAREVTTKYRMKEWTGIVQDRINSGLTTNEYCDQNGLSRNAYFYWREKIPDTNRKRLPRSLESPGLPIPIMRILE